VGGFIMFIFMSIGADFLSFDLCMELMSMPGMPGVAGCWAARESGANRMRESRVDARLLGMRDLSSERAFVGRQREEVRGEAAGSEEDQIRRAIRGGNRGGTKSGVAAEKMAGAGRLGAMGAKAFDKCAGRSTSRAVAVAEGC